MATSRYSTQESSTPPARVGLADRIPESRGLVVAVIAAVLVATEPALGDVVYVGSEVVLCAVVEVDSASVTLRLPDGRRQRVRRADVRSVQVGDWLRRDSLAGLLGDIPVVFDPQGDPLFESAGPYPNQGTDVSRELIRQTGDELSGARDAFLWSIGLAFAGGLVYGVANANPNAREPLLCFYVPVGFAVGSLASMIVAWVRIGEAGTRLQRAADMGAMKSRRDD